MIGFCLFSNMKYARAPSRSRRQTYLLRCHTVLFIPFHVSPGSHYHPNSFWNSVSLQFLAFCFYIVRVLLRSTPDVQRMLPPLNPLIPPQQGPPTGKGAEQDSLSRLPEIRDKQFSKTACDIVMFVSYTHEKHVDISGARFYPSNI